MGKDWVPNHNQADVDRTQLAWREHIFERIKVMFGYGGLAF